MALKCVPCLSIQLFLHTNKFGQAKECTAFFRLSKLICIFLQTTVLASDILKYLFTVLPPILYLFGAEIGDFFFCIGFLLKTSIAILN